MSNESPPSQSRLEMIERRIDKDITGAIAPSRNGAMAFANMNQILEFGKLMALAGVAVPKHLRENPGACVAVAIQASEWEMSPFAVAGKTYVVNDRLGFEAQLVNAVILMRAPIVGRFKISYRGDGPKRQCKVVAKLTDGDDVEYESPEIAKIPVQNSPLWKGDPDQQLFYYSSRAMCRRHFPDVILGVYTPDELEEPEMKTAKGWEVPAANVPRGAGTPPVDNAHVMEGCELFSGAERPAQDGAPIVQAAPDKAESPPPDSNVATASEAPATPRKRASKAAAPGVVSGEPAAADKFSVNPPAPDESPLADPVAPAAPKLLTKRDEFWQKCHQAGFKASSVMAKLREHQATEGKEPGDLTDDEAASVLYIWPKFVQVMEGGPK